MVQTIMSSSDAKVSSKRLNSRAWIFFKIKDNDTQLAKCKLCQKLLSYRTSVSNLLKHVKKRHKRAYYSDDKSENDEVSAFSLSENEDDCKNDLEDNNIFKDSESNETKIEEESVCLLCQKTFSNQDSADMMEHMFKVHNVSEIKLVDRNVHVEHEENKSVKFISSKRSCCWDYFVMKNKEEKLAVCNLCNRELSYKSSVSNLVKHLQKKHKMLPKKHSIQYIRESDDIYKQRSRVWEFYNYVNDERTVCACVYCNAKFSVVGGMTNMKRHLVDKHPEALLHYKTNSDDPLFITANDENNEGSDEENIQAEYLEIDDLDMQDKVKLKPSIELRSSYERKPSFERSPKRPRIHHSPIPIENNVPSLTKVPDSLEHFSNYITSLLQELPENISKKLQMNFVKQIIEAQISYADIENAKETATRINSNTISGTVSNSDESVIVEESVTGSEDILNASVEIANSDRIVDVSNGIIIHPTLTRS